MKLCFSTLGCSDRALDQILTLALKYNISALEIRGIGGILDNAKIIEFSPEKLKSTADEFEKFGVKIIAGFDCNEKAIQIGKNAKAILPIKDIETFCKENTMFLEKNA